jgi:endo-1,4-beta-mannosidase
VSDDATFLQGINYWPIHKAMYWWKNFDPVEVDRDFRLLQQHSFGLVRLFLTWEDFQPRPDRISDTALQHLALSLDIAAARGLKVMPTFFCGHMSGVNWMPAWMLAEHSEPQPFDIYAGGVTYKDRGLRDCYTDGEVISAQACQIAAVCDHIHGHEALFGYDLGNENSNFAIPPNRDAACRWLEIMTSTIHQHSPGYSVTIGMHSEDLEQDRRMWPQDAGYYCDYLSMHGYPSYLSWIRDPFDAHALAFLATITEWLGGKPVLLEEFGAPTCRSNREREEASVLSLYPLFNEEQARDFYCQSVDLLQQEHCLGAIAWCFADYHPRLWDRPPLDRRIHERYFGLFRSDHSAKPAIEAFHAQRQYIPAQSPLEVRHPWLRNCVRDDFYTNPIGHLSAMYDQYRLHKGLKPQHFV